MDKEYTLQVMLDKGGDSTLDRTDLVRVRWNLQKTNGAEIFAFNANLEEILETLKGVLKDLPGVDDSWFTRYGGEINLAEHITTPDQFIGRLKSFIEKDLAALLAGRTQIVLSTEVTVL